MLRNSINVFYYIFMKCGYTDILLDIKNVCSSLLFVMLTFKMKMKRVLIV